MTTKTLTRTRQETGSYCGPAVVQMLLSAIDIQIDQETIVEAHAPKEVVMREGITLTGLAKAVKKIIPDIEVWHKYQSTITDLKNLVDSGYCVGIDWQGIFNNDEYGDEYWNYKSEWQEKWKKWRGIPTLKGDQGHYIVALEVNQEKGFLRFADPYGHYAGKDRFIALWEFEERWWDDRIGLNENGKKIYILENKLIFVIVPKGDTFLPTLGMEKVNN